MPSQKKHSHDVLFKSLLSRKDVVRDFLQVFLPDISGYLDFSTLEFHKKSFVDQQMKESFSDLVVSCRTTVGEALIVFLYEHKSKKDKYLYVQLLNYITRIFRFYQRQKQRLPIVVPVVFYHGQEKFVYPNYDEIFVRAPEIFGRFIPKFNVKFFDLYTYGEEYIKRAEDHFILLILIGLLSYVFKQPEQMIEFLLFVKNRHKDKFGSHKEILELTLNYLGKFRKFAEEPYNKQIMDTLFKDIDYEPGSLIDQWVKRGYEEATEKNIVKMLRKGFSVKDIAEILEVDEEFVLKVKQAYKL